MPNAIALPDVIYRKTNFDAGILAKDESKLGEIIGHAAVFNNVDLMGDIIRPGAFKRTIRERVKAGKVGLMVRHFAHGGDTVDAIGQIVLGKEDSFGLMTESDLFDTQLAQETRFKVKKSPNLFGMSVGYKIKKSANITDKDGNVTGLELLELALFEVTVTMMPANDKTNAGAKTEVEALRHRVEELEGKVPATTEDSQDATKIVVSHSYQPVAERMQRETALLRLRH